MRQGKNAEDSIGIRNIFKGVSVGELEVQILDIAWDLEPPVTARRVFRVMYPIRELTYSTILLTMMRMVRKGLMEQHHTGGRTAPFVYVPLFSRRQMAVQLMNGVCERILHLPLADAIASLCGSPGAPSRVDLTRLPKIPTGR